MQKIAVSFVIEANDPYDDKILDLVKAIKAQGGEISGARIQPTATQSAVRVPGAPASTQFADLHHPGPPKDGTTPIVLSKLGKPAPPENAKS